MVRDSKERVFYRHSKSATHMAKVVTKECTKSAILKPKKNPK